MVAQNSPENSSDQKTSCSTLRRAKDEEIAHHAVVCHAEQARIYRKLSNSDEERKQYAVAANILEKAFQQEANNRSRCRTPQATAKVECNWRHVEVCFLAILPVYKAILFGMHAVRGYPSCTNAPR
ncbi:hypothetical protein COOONC_04876 [Cooperia oncophora]